MANNIKSILLVAGLIVGTGLALLVPFLLILARGLIVTIDDLKTTYTAGENITFTVNVEGQLDKLCNYHTYPSVIIQSEGTEEVVYENQAMYLGISCDPSSSYVSSHWTYPIQRDHEAWGINSTKENISISKAGSYVLTVSFDKERITKQFAIVSSMPTPMPPLGISLVIENYGEREFYQDRKVFLPTMLAVTKEEPSDWERLAWPSIGPNYVITRIDSGTGNDGIIVFDYYASLAIHENLTGMVYDEFMRRTDLSPPPATSGRYFGFEWNQTALDGTMASPGRYEVTLTMPVLIDEMTSGEDKRTTIMLSSEPDYFSILDGSPRYLEHEFSLTQKAIKTQLETGEPFSHSLFLVNNGNSTQYFSIDAGGAEFFTEKSLKLANQNNEQQACYFPSANGIKREEWGRMSMYANYFTGEKSVTPGGILAIANDTLISAPNYPGIYYLAGKVTLTIADEEIEGKSEFDSVKVSCLDVAIENPIMLNVTAPVYDGVRLVVETDKNVYSLNETVAISLYIENNSDKPFKLNEVFPSMKIKDASTGREVYGISWVADYSVYPTVWPHSIFTLNTGTQLTWDQTIYLEDGKANPAEPGQYLIEATFTSPYLQSDTRTITIE